MAVADIDPKAAIHRVGDTYQVATGEAIPPGVLVPDTILAIPGNPSQILRLRSIAEAAADHRDDALTFTNLTVRGTKVYIRRELDAIRPLVLIVPDRRWSAYSNFKEGGLYQAWPNGTLFKVQNWHLVDPYTGTRLYATGDRSALAALIPVFIERWVPATTPTPPNPNAPDME